MAKVPFFLANLGVNFRKSMDKVTHSGTVEAMEKDNYIIHMVSTSPCASCHAKDACPSSDKKDKYITISKQDCRELHEGEIVNVIISTKNGQKAFVIAYTTPVLLIVLSVILLNWLDVSQAISALSIIVILVIYFFGLYVFKGKIEKGIKIKVE